MASACASTTQGACAVPVCCAATSAIHSYVNVVACKSAISYIDGNKGILRYRGIPIEQLAERASFLEVRSQALIQP